MYDQALTSQVVLYNSGKVGFDYCALDIDDSSLHELTPGSLSIHPHTGHLPALEEQVITITYLPSAPAVFQKRLKIQVAHFEPDVITLTGEAVFPRISFNTPRDMSQIPESIFEQAKTNLNLSSVSVGNGLGGSDQLRLDAELERLLVGHSLESSAQSTEKRCVHPYILITYVKCLGILYTYTSYDVILYIVRLTSIYTCAYNCIVAII